MNLAGCESAMGTPQHLIQLVKLFAADDRQQLYYSSHIKALDLSYQQSCPAGC